MRRGAITNTPSPTIWVLSDVLLEAGARAFWIGPKREVARRTDWLWRVNSGYESVIIYINRSPSPHFSHYGHKVFNTLQTAISAFKTDMRAGLFIVEDTANTSPPSIISFSRSSGIFNGY